MKKCSICKEKKPLNEFHSRKLAKDGKCSSCKKCNSILKKKYYQDNKSTINENIKNKRKKVSEMSEKQLLKTRAKRLRYYYKNISNETFRLRTSISNLIRYGFKTNNIKKTLKSEQILGCSFEEFKLYLENQFESWMNWDNRGKYNGTLNYGWDIDHIIPISSAKTEEDIIRLNVLY